MKTYLVKSGGTYLVSFTEYSSRWHMLAFEAHHYTTREEAQVVAYALGGDVEEYACLS